MEGVRLQGLHHRGEPVPSEDEKERYNNFLEAWLEKLAVQAPACETFIGAINGVVNQCFKIKFDLRYWIKNEVVSLDVHFVFHGPSTPQ